MGWYQDEETTWFPDWAVKPLMWVGSLMAAVLPAGFTITMVKLIWPSPPLALNLGIYAVSVGFMLAAVKPWTAR